MLRRRELARMDIEVSSQGQLIACLKACLAFMDVECQHLAAAYLSQSIEVLEAAPVQPNSNTEDQ